jgi:hypothetical protein
MSLIESGRAEASPIGEATQFEKAIAEFTMAYTDQTERDRRAFVDAIKSDRIRSGRFHCFQRHWPLLEWVAAELKARPPVRRKPRYAVSGRCGGG